MCSPTKFLIWPPCGTVIWPPCRTVIWPPCGTVIWPPCGTVIWPPCGTVIWPPCGTVICWPPECSCWSLIPAFRWLKLTAGISHHQWTCPIVYCDGSVWNPPVNMPCCLFGPTSLSLCCHTLACGSNRAIILQALEYNIICNILAGEAARVIVGLERLIICSSQQNTHIHLLVKTDY